MLKKELEEIGLSEKEADIYLALLSVDRASVLELSKKTSVNRSTVYPVLESLSKKGLVSETQEGKKVYFQAEPPERLETFVERQKVLLNEKAKRLKSDIIPQLKSTQKGEGEKPIVKYFEGKDGIISANADFLKNNKKNKITYLIYPNDLLYNLFSEEELKKHRKNRIDKHIKSKVLYTYTKGNIPSDELGDRIKIDEKKYPITCDIAIYENKVRISVLGKKLSGIFIESEEFADTMRSLFNLAFDGAKKEA